MGGKSQLQLCQSCLTKKKFFSRGLLARWLLFPPPHLFPVQENNTSPHQGAAPFPSGACSGGEGLSTAFLCPVGPIVPPPHPSYGGRGLMAALVLSVLWDRDELHISMCPSSLCPCLPS